MRSIQVCAFAPSLRCRPSAFALPPSPRPAGKKPHIFPRTAAASRRRPIAMDDPTTITLTALSGLLATLTLSTALSPTPTSPPLTHPAPPLDLRTFTARELRALPGVGERRAIDIVRARATHAISGTVDSLDRVFAWRDATNLHLDLVGYERIAIIADLRIATQQH